ncbi:hypothetical protein RKLH11_504 [Rhodobacteraceae bacterium KLH11]|nr:hypothetical protein RKLH11_504 [Rhodobacteraceae bacterium KLH11]
MRGHGYLLRKRVNDGLFAVKSADQNKISISLISDLHWQHA